MMYEKVRPRLKPADSHIVFSLDVDWAPDCVLEWALAQFTKRSLPVTVFATHATALLNNPPDGVEVGIHPDFFRNPDHEQHIHELMALYPEAKGVRSHGLFEYSNLINCYRRCGLTWDSSQLLYRCDHIRPYRHPSGLIRLPIYWEDDDYFSDNPDWNIEHLHLDTPGVKCFDFHPIHLYLNSVSGEQYRKARNASFTKEALAAQRYDGTDKGVLRFFESLCARVAANNYQVSTIGGICQCH